VTARGKGSARIARESSCGMEVRFIADDSSRPVEAIAKQSVSCLSGAGETPLNSPASSGNEQAACPHALGRSNLARHDTERTQREANSHRRGVNGSWTGMCETSKTAEEMPGWANRPVTAREIPKIVYATTTVGSSAASAFNDEELFAVERCDQDQLEGALLARSDYRVGGQGGRDDRGNQQHVQQRYADPRFEP
jgi:hypothetical protein